MGGSPIWWLIGGLVVLAVLWFLFTRLATSDPGAKTGAKDLRGPSGAAWTPKHPDAEGADGPLPPDSGRT